MTKIFIFVILMNALQQKAAGLLCLMMLVSARQDLVAQRDGRPNVLFISVDDMNDATTLFNPSHPIRTPELERLASRGIFFTRAYCASPSCHPSRMSVLTGTRPHRTGIYENNTDASDLLATIRTLPRLFRESGYFVCGAGKTFHHESDWAFHDRASFEEYLLMSINEPYPSVKLTGMSWFGTRNTDWGIFPYDASLTADHRTVEYAERQLKRKHDRPFFLSVGIYKPHSPFFAPKSYFDAYPLPSLRMPDLPSDDMADLPTGAISLQQLRSATGPGRSYGSGRGFWQGLQRANDSFPGIYKSFLQAYYACSSFADDMIGRVVRALEQSDYRDNTIIVLWSDHGFHTGEKEQIEKFALWEKTTHVPLIFMTPGGVRNRRIDQPVDLTSIYPTLAELCGLPLHREAVGKSLVPLLYGQPLELPPAVMTYREGNHAVRTARWRFIRYADGSEELYDHDVDPGEYRNIASDTSYSLLKDWLRTYLPKTNMLSLRGKQ